MTEAPSAVVPPPPPASVPPSQPNSAKVPNHQARWAVLKLGLGILLLAVLAYFFWTKGEWKTQVFVWVLITILADELGGWFGYAALCLVALVFLAPYALPTEWYAIAPLLGGALFALLIVKHSGKILVLPFAGLIFYGTIWITQKIGPELDSNLNLAARKDFQEAALTAMALGLGFSLLRQVGVWLWRKWSTYNREKVIERRFQQAMLAVDEPPPNNSPQSKPRPEEQTY